MLSEMAKTLLEFLKLAPRFLTALGFAAGLLLFSNEHFLNRIGLAEFVQKYRFVLGLTLVISVALLAVHVTLFVLRGVRRWWTRRGIDRRVIARLHNLTEDEKQILRYYLVKDTRANMLRVENGVVQELASEGIIYRSASMGNMLEGFAHNISDLAWDYLHLHPELLDGTTNLYHTDKRVRLR
ncbi:MAG: superinfection exclusion B family protein [Bryobacteraceae bacterium]|jgi:hypothetical protein